MDERGCLQTVARSLALYVVACQATELGVHHGRQGLERALIPVAPGEKESADLVVYRNRSGL
jgi:hypothetical protein